MKYLKCFESFEKEWSELSDKEKRELQYNDELINDIIKNHEIDMSSSFDDIEEGKEYLYSFLNYYFNILPEKFKLYRVVVADDKNDIDLHNIGSHYVLDKRLLSDGDFLYDIGVTSIDNSKIDKLWCVEVVAKKSDVDIKTTLINRFMYPNEEEITLNKNYKPISYNVEKIELY